MNRIFIVSLFFTLTLFGQINTSVGVFKSCSTKDSLDIEFEGLDIDFSSGKNNYSGYDFCIKDKDGKSVPNPKYIGKQFIITWTMIKTKVMITSLESRKTEIWKMPSIISIQLLDKSKGYEIGVFDDCSMGDVLHITFKGIGLDFGSGRNNFLSYKLCIEDMNLNTVPNPLYVGKKFLIKHKMMGVKVMTDPLAPSKTETRKKPSIQGLRILK